jgi:hypothetical protein
MSDAPSSAWAYLPSTATEGGDVWFNKSKGYYDNPVRGNYANATFLHEPGHALVLEHTHEHRVMPANRDSTEYSIMNYNSYAGATESGYTNEMRRHCLLFLPQLQPFSVTSVGKGAAARATPYTATRTCPLPKGRVSLRPKLTRLNLHWRALAGLPFMMASSSKTSRGR